MKPTTTTPAPYAAWQADLVKAIRATIKRARRDGLTGMGIDNLRQGTRIPVGGPTGTNVQYFYAMVWFPAALAALKGADAAFIK
jgi:hypothetical protein